MGMTVSMAFQYGRTVDLVTAEQVGKHWALNLTCNLEARNGSPNNIPPYVNRTALEREGAETISFRYADKRNQAILTFKDEEWFLNGEYLCSFGY